MTRNVVTVAISNQWAESTFATSGPAMTMAAQTRGNALVAWHMFVSGAVNHIEPSAVRKCLAGVQIRKATRAKVVERKDRKERRVPRGPAICDHPLNLLRQSSRQHLNQLWTGWLF